MEVIREEENDFWNGAFEREVLFRVDTDEAIDGDDGDDDESSFARLRPGQAVPQGRRFPQPKRKQEDPILDEPGPSNFGRSADDDDDEDDKRSEFGLARFLKRPKN